MPNLNTYWTSVFKKIFYLILIILGIILGLKLAIFYMPFLIAFILYLLIEPLIKWIMKHFKLNRKTSSIIVFIIVFGSLIGLLTLGIVTIISETSNLLSNFNEYYEKIYSQIQIIISNFNFDKLNISTEVQDFLQNITFSLLEKISEYMQTLLSSLIKGVTSLPTIAIYFAVSLLALYFICTDKIYMLDEFEHHFPEKWVKEISIHIYSISKTLGGYLKAQATLILISFIISLIGLYLMEFLGFNVGFPLLIALGISFIDALPILGSGSVMVPWAIFSALNGNINLGMGIIILWIIMSLIRQFIEPKIVSRQYWHTSNFYNYCNVHWV